MRIELTRDGITARRLVLKTRGATRHHPLPLLLSLKYYTLWLVLRQMKNIVDASGEDFPISKRIIVYYSYCTKVIYLS